MNPHRSTLFLVAATILLVIAFAPPTSLAKHDAKESTNKDDQPTVKQLQEQVKQLQKQIDKLSAAIDRHEAGSDRKHDKRDPDKSHDGADGGKDKNFKSRAASSGKPKDQSGDKRAQQGGVMVPVSQLPPGIAKRFHGQKFAPASALPPGIAKRFTGAHADNAKDRSGSAKGGKARKHEKDKDDDDDDDNRRDAHRQGKDKAHAVR